MIMRKCNHAQSRPGTIITLLAFTMVALLGFLALAIDLGMLAIAKTQAQNAADVAALTAARTLNGNSASSYNNSTATSNANAILSYNTILGNTIQSSQLTLTYGSYDYNSTTQVFANYPPTSGMPWTAVAATVNSTNLKGSFSKVFREAIPADGHLHGAGSAPPARHRPGDGPFRLDALRHVAGVRLLYRLAHHE